MLCAPLRHQSWVACFGLINQVVTWVELCGYSAPDVPLISAWSPVHQGIVTTGKTSPTKNLIPFITTSPPSLFLPHQSPSFSTFGLYPRLAPLSTPGGLEKTSPILMLQEPATSQSIISPNLWSMLPVAQVTVTSLQKWNILCKSLIKRCLLIHCNALKPEDLKY